MECRDFAWKAYSKDPYDQNIKRSLASLHTQSTKTLCMYDENKLPWIKEDLYRSRVQDTSASTHDYEALKAHHRLRSPASMHTHSTETLWMYDEHKPPWIQEDLYRSRLQDTNASTHDYEALNVHHVFRDRTTLLNSIKHCGKQKDLRKGSSLHAIILERGLLNTDITLGNALLSMYAKCGAFSKAQELFDQLPAQNVVTWNSLISGYAQHGLADEALSCFRQMREEGLSPDAVTFICILKACGSIGALEKGEKIHAELGRQGLLENDLVLGTALVDMYAKCGALAKAQAMFNKLSTHDVVAWNALIAGYAQHGLGNEALSSFRQMQDEGLSPNAVTFVCILKACGSIKAVDKGEEIHIEVGRQGLLEKNNVLGTALVDMYAKCGALAKAQGVFDKLSGRDVVTWNSIIAGYVQHGLGDEALRCFRRMQDEGIFPDAVTFVCILKACGSIGAIEMGEEIHAEVSRQGLLIKDKVLGTALVDMYVKCGALAKAQAVFDKLPAPDVATWTALIGGYVQHGLNDEALGCFERMQAKGLSPDTVAYTCTLKACGNLRKAKKGEEIHVEVSRQGFLEKDSGLGTTLVDMYAKCGALAKAQAVFDKLPTRSVVTWNALIAGYAQHGHGDKALGFFRRMQDEGLSPNAVTFVCILQACGSIGAIEMGDEIFAEVGKQGLLEEDIVVGNALVDMYAKCGALAKAQAVFDKLGVRDVVTWNTLIAGYAQHGLSEEALRCFKRMRDGGFSPDAVTFVYILQACGSVGAAELGEEIHAEIGRQGLLEKDNVLGTALVDMYAKCGALAKAQGVFDKLPARDVVTWNVLVAGYVQHKLGNEALRCYGHMRDEGISPDAVTFSCILKACGSIGAAHKGEEIHAELGRHESLEEDIVLGTALVDMYAKCGALANAQGVFDKLPERDIVTWNALIAGYAQKGLGEEALSCFGRMRDEGLSADTVTFMCILKACGSIGAAKMGEEICAEVGRQGLLEKETDNALGTALVDMYAKCGAIAKAQALFDNLQARSVVMWNALIAGYGQVGKVRAVFDTFIKMVEEYTTPDKVTFVVLLNACSHAGLVKEAQTYFEIMSNVYSIIPSLEHCTCMVDNFSRAGLFDKAISVIEKVPPSDHLQLWSTLMGACQRSAKVELGMWAFEHAVMLDKKDAAAYVCMSNIYAAPSMQEVDEVEENCSMEENRMLLVD